MDVADVNGTYYLDILNNKDQALSLSFKDEKVFKCVPQTISEIFAGLNMTVT